MRLGQIGILFTILYFMQGIAEPTDGLLAQPVRALLKQWGRSPSEITAFVAWCSIPWALKVFFGFLVDFFPIGRSRYRSYLLLTTGLCAAGMLMLFLNPPSSSSTSLFLLEINFLTAAVSCADVAADALMVEVGQPTGLTGRLQSIQWTAMYAASILAGYLGGALSMPGRQGYSFLVCALVSVFTFASVALLLPSRGHMFSQPPPTDLREALRLFVRGCRTAPMMSVGALLFVSSFNLFSQALLYLHMTVHLHYSELFYGKTLTYMSISSMVASAVYGLYCRRLPVSSLVHILLVTGIVSMLLYLPLKSEHSALLISWVMGFTYQTGTMAQCDLAAQAVPSAIAGTGFAMLMAIMNLSSLISVWLGGVAYEMLLPRLGATHAFELILLCGVVTTAAGWLLLPWVRRSLARMAPEI